MTAGAIKISRIRAAQTQIGNKSLQPADQPPLLTRLSDVPNLLRRQTETGHIYKYKGAVFARSRQTSGFPSGAKCRSRKVGRRRPRPAPPRKTSAGRRTRGSEARAPPDPTPEAAETVLAAEKSGRGFGFSKIFSIFVPRQILPKMKLYGFAYFFYSFFFYTKRKCGTPCIG